MLGTAATGDVATFTCHAVVVDFNSKSKTKVLILQHKIKTLEYRLMP